MKRLLTLIQGVTVAGYLLMSAGALANGGDDHPHDQAAAPLAAALLAPRMEAASRAVELVAVLQGSELIVYLDHYASNEPLEDATLSLDAGNQTYKAEPAGPGLYRLANAKALRTPGDHELVFTVEAAGLNDVLIGTLRVALKSEPAATGTTFNKVDYLWLGGASVIGLLAGLVLRRRRLHPAALLMTLAALLALALTAPPALAHEGEDHSTGPTSAAPLPTGSAPQRLSDGSLLIPKPVQRLLGIRTVLAEVRDLPKTLELNGHLIADPNRSGRVQAAQTGRLEPAPEGLPHLGQTVRAGQVLAYLIPVAATLETANQQAQLAELDSQINLAGRRLARLQQLTGSVAQREIEEARTELKGLRKRHAAVGGGLSLREPLQAPVDGVISAAFAVAGQVVEGRETLFEIINPHQWWVEAIVYDAGLDEEIRSALAQTFDGRTVMPLQLLGMGYQRRSQGLPLQFRITGEFDGLSAGQPVRILAQTRETVRGTPVPRDSLIRGSGGETTVWVHVSAERFTARRVHAEAVDGATLVVTEGLGPGERIVTQGTALLAQVR